MTSTADYAPAISVLENANKLYTIAITRDSSPVGNCTGIVYTLVTMFEPGGYSKTDTINLGKMPNTSFDPSSTIQLTTHDFTNEHVNKVLIWAQNFISRVGFYS